LYRIFIKRVIDICAALILSLPLIMIIFLVGVLIKLEDKGPVFYNASRVGMRGKTFKMLKFRTMKVNAPDIRNEDGSTYNSEDDPRLTRIGKFLRKSSIDELPQIFNVIKGDMSFIGPRPTLNGKRLEKYDDVMKKKIQVRPGLTGYSQAYFRNSITQEEKYKSDAFYAENLSFILDVKVLFKTIVTILKKEHVYNKNSIKELNNE
jgi:undecaprenyl phosphate N,N'-diacetylbacillosamine 1-phosphate transferase